MITKEEIKKIASLAKINISDNELDNYSGQISKILEPSPESSLRRPNNKCSDPT